MAGIGLELRRLYDRRALFLKATAWQCGGIVCSGPLLFSLFMITAIVVLTNVGLAEAAERNLLICLLTYTMVASLLVSSPFVQVVNRYVADMIYEKRLSRIMPSFFGYVAALMLAGGTLFGVYLCFCGIALELRVLCLVLFLELTVVWAEIQYLNAIKDYKGILLGFFCPFLLSAALGVLLVLQGLSPVTSLLLSFVIGYGVMLTWYLVLLLRAFPDSEGSPFAFLRWFGRFPALSAVGFLQIVGLFGHQALMWTGPLSVEVAPMLLWAPHYDVPVFLAFLTTLFTTVSFTLSVESRFYPKYRAYFQRLNERSTLRDLELAEKDMMDTLSQELFNTALKQCLVVVACVVLSSALLPLLNMGITTDMIATFQILCVGYAFFAIGNMFMLSKLYFTGIRQALVATALFALGSIAGTVLTISGSFLLYGYGLLLGAGLYCFSSWLLLRRYEGRIRYSVLGNQ